MLKQIELKNFKAFSENGAIAELAPITLICGQNSAGKSSLMQSLLMLSQTIQLQDNNLDSSDIVTSGKYVDLGNFNSLVNSHDSSKTLQISLTFKNTKLTSKHKENKLSLLFESSIKFNEDENNNFGRLKNIEFSSILSNSENFNFILTRTNNDRTFSFEPNTNFYKILSSLPVGPRETHIYRRIQREKNQSIREKLIKSYQLALKNSSSKAELSKISEQLDEIDYQEQKSEMMEYGDNISYGNLHHRTIDKLRTYTLSNRDRFINMRRGSGSYLPSSFDDQYIENREITIAEMYMQRIASYISSMNSVLTTTLGQLSYLGPLRSAPQRSYSHKVGKALSVGNSGEDIVQMLSVRVEQSSNKYKFIEEYLNEECSNLGIPYKFNAFLKSEDVAGDLVILNVTDIRTNTIVALTDVGFGISQLLPIIIQATYSYETSKNKTGLMLVEQPELHLHPNLQAKIADFIIRKSKPSQNREGLQWIIETHSESLIRRLQRRVKEKKLKPEDISILYVDRVGDYGSVIKRLRLDEYGDFIDSWPDGFFVDAFSDLIDE
jgi:predicted ATPase